MNIGPKPPKPPPPQPPPRPPPVPGRFPWRFLLKEIRWWAMLVIGFFVCISFIKANVISMEAHTTLVQIAERQEVRYASDSEAWKSSEQGEVARAEQLDGAAQDSKSAADAAIEAARKIDSVVLDLRRLEQRLDARLDRLEVAQ